MFFERKHKEIAVFVIILLLAILFVFKYILYSFSIWYIRLIFGLLIFVSICCFFKGLKGVIWGLTYGGLFVVALLLTVLLDTLFPAKENDGTSPWSIAGIIIVTMCYSFSLPKKLTNKIIKKIPLELGTERKDKNPDDPDIGLNTSISFQYTELRNFLITPLYSLKRTNELHKKIRIACAIALFVLGLIIVLLCEILTFYYDFPAWLGFIGFYCWVYAAFELFWGFQRGAAITICSFIIIPAVYLMYIFTNIAFDRSSWIGYIAVIYDFAVVFIGIFYLIRWLLRRQYSYTQMFVRDNKAISVPFRVITDGCRDLLKVTVRFKPFKNCDTYYFRNKASDLYQYCSIKKYFFAGLCADIYNSEIIYYVYVPYGKKAGKILRRYFSGWRNSSVDIEILPDETFSEYKKLLPDLKEQFSMFNEMIIPCISIDENREYETAYIVNFGEFAYAKAFTAEARNSFISAKIAGLDDEIDKVNQVVDEADGVDKNKIDEHEDEFDNENYEDEPVSYKVIVKDRVFINKNIINAKINYLIDIATKYNGEVQTWNIQNI